MSRRTPASTVVVLASIAVVIASTATVAVVFRGSPGDGSPTESPARLAALTTTTTRRPPDPPNRIMHTVELAGTSEYVGPAPPDMEPVLTVPEVLEIIQRQHDLSGEELSYGPPDVRFGLYTSTISYSRFHQNQLPIWLVSFQGSKGGVVSSSVYGRNLSTWHATAPTSQPLITGGFTIADRQGVLMAWTGSVSGRGTPSTAAMGSRELIGAYPWRWGMFRSWATM